MGGFLRGYANKDIIAMKLKGTKNLTYTQRLQIEQCFNAGLTRQAIADKLGIGIATVYRELRRGKYEHKVKSYYDCIGEPIYKTETRYSPELAQSKYEINKTSHGPQLKIGNDFEFVRYVEKRIIKDHISPCAVCGEIKRNKLFKTTISKTTMYRYIEMGIFMNITMSHLPVGLRKKQYRKVKEKRPPRGTSIEKRPKEIAERNTFGHWEMDCVVGKQETKSVLLVLTERLTRYELIFKMPNKKAESVVKCLNKLEYKYGKDFRKIFKSITVDNGTEFSDFNGIERSIYKGKRVDVYYCHPYSSCERGSNERINRDIRRLLPKGTNFTPCTDEEIQAVQDWVNDYPRAIFGYESAAVKFAEQLAAI